MELQFPYAVRKQKWWWLQGTWRSKYFDSLSMKNTGLMFQLQSRTRQRDLSWPFELFEKSIQWSRKENQKYYIRLRCSCPLIYRPLILSRWHNQNQLVVTEEIRILAASLLILYSEVNEFCVLMFFLKRGQEEDGECSADPMLLYRRTFYWRCISWPSGRSWWNVLFLFSDNSTSEGIFIGFWLLCPSRCEVNFPQT